MCAAGFGHLPCVQFLLSSTSGCIVDMVNNFNYTALMYAASSGHLSCVKYLTLVKEDDQVGLTNALAVAQSSGSKDCAEYLRYVIMGGKK
eukprot:gene23326-31657_t